ncbi:MAG TPA: PilZ domain-containing protein [bacterium]|nr:PilZ domain-containing protein [bacterium]
MARSQDISSSEAGKALRKKRPKDAVLRFQEYLTSSSSAEEVLFKINELLYAPGAESTRKYVRAPVSIPVVFKIGEQSFSSTTYTLSQKGAFIKFTDPPAKSTRIIIELHLPDGGEVARMEAEVVHSASLQEAMSRADVSGMSVVFKKMKPEDRRRIDKLVRARARKMKSRAGK